MSAPEIELEVNVLGDEQRHHVRIAESAEANLYLHIDGVEYGSLFLQRDGGRITVTLGQFDHAEQEWVERGVVGPVRDTRARPALPEPGRRFDTSEVVVASCWQCDDPEDPEGPRAYTATLLTVSDDPPFYSVVQVTADGDGEWQVQDVDSFEDIFGGSEEYRKWAR